MQKLTGTLPSELGLAMRIYHSELHLSSNFISGILPSEIGLMTDLLALHLAKNELTGALPSELGLLAQSDNPGGGLLKVLDVSNNYLIGDVPEELCFLAKLIDDSPCSYHTGKYYIDESGKAQKVFANCSLFFDCAVDRLCGCDCQCHQLEGALPSQYISSP